MSVKLHAEEVSEHSLRRFMFRNDRLNYSFCVYPDASKPQYNTAVDGNTTSLRISRSIHRVQKVLRLDCSHIALDERQVSHKTVPGLSTVRIVNGEYPAKGFKVPRSALFLPESDRLSVE